MVAVQALPGGYQVGDTVYSKVKSSHPKDAKKNIVPGNKGQVTGRADEPNHTTKVEVRFETDLFLDFRLESISKTVSTYSGACATLAAVYCAVCFSSSANISFPVAHHFG